MAKSIKNRVFGSDVPVLIKKKIEARQMLAYQAPVEPGQQINPSAYPDKRDAHYTFAELNEMNFDGIAELSSRTPFVRMWTSLNLARDTIIGGEMTEKEKEDWESKKFKENESGEPVNLEKEDYKDIYLKKVNDKYEKHKWDQVGDFRKIYQLGNHVLNTLEKGPNTPITGNVTDGDVTVQASTVVNVLPNEQELDGNQFLKPPAGITSLSSATEGALGTIKRTTVEFQVHNFADFEAIYLRYFLKPGAQIFVDFGWDTAFLYDIKKLLDSSDIEDFLYGEDGCVSKSAGDLETMVGYVVNYDASVRDDGGFDCSVEIVSKNSALLNTAFDPNLKERVKYGLDIEALGLAVAGVLGDASIYEKAAMWGGDAETEEELRSTLEAAAAKLLGGTDNPLPGIKPAKAKYIHFGPTDQASMLALEHGVFYAGSTEENMKLFINFGWFEDKFLNKEFGFSDSQKALMNKDKTSSTEDEGSLKSKFNSRNSFCTYGKDLKNAMTMRGFYKGAHVLYPESWGDDGPTYNTKIGMIPDDHLKDGNDKGLLKEDSTYNTSPPMVTIAEWDKNMKRIPLREIFLSVDMIKSSMDRATSAAEFFKNLFEKISEATGGLIDLAVKSNSYAMHTLAFIDKNQMLATNNEPKSPDEMPEFLKKLLVFKPYTRNTIVKEYDLSFTMPEGGLGNMLAIQATDSLSPSLSINSIIDGFVQFEMLNRIKENNPDVFVRYNPSIGDEAGRRFTKVTSRGNAGTFNFSKDDIAFNQSDATLNALKDMNKGGGVFKDSVNMPYGQKVTADKFGEVIKYNLDLAVSPNDDIDGSLAKPKDKQEGTVEDTKKSEEALARSKGQRLASDVYDWHLKNATYQMSLTTQPLIPIEAKLSIYGISSFVPGDLVRINYLPKNYLNNVYFQIMKVSHEVSTSWTTSFETQMRICSVNKQDDGGPFVVGKSYLRNVLKLRDIDDYIHLFGNLTPKEIPEDTFDIDHKFLCEIAGTPDGEKLTLPALPTNLNEKESLGDGMRTLVGLDKGKDGWDTTAGVNYKGPSGLKLKIWFQDWTDLGIGLQACGGFMWELTNFKKKESDNSQFYIYTSGANWVIHPLDTDLISDVYEQHLDRVFKICSKKKISQKLTPIPYSPKPMTVNKPPSYKK